MSCVLKIGKTVVCFDVDDGCTVLKRWRIVAPCRIGRLRVTRRRRDGCTSDGGRVGYTRRCARDNGYARGCCRHSGRIRLPPHVLCVWQFVVLLPFHAPVLEPDFDLTLR